MPERSPHLQLCLKEMVCRALNGVIKKQMRQNARRREFSSIIVNATHVVNQWHQNFESFWSTTIYDILTSKYVNPAEKTAWQIFRPSEIRGVSDLRLSLVPCKYEENICSEEEMKKEGWNQFVERFNQISTVEILPGEDPQHPLVLNPIVRTKKLSNLVLENYSNDIQLYIEQCEAKFSTQDTSAPAELNQSKSCTKISKELLYQRLRVLSKALEKNLTLGETTDSTCIRITDSEFQLFSSCTGQGKPMRSLPLSNQSSTMIPTEFNSPLNVVIDPCLIGGDFAMYENHTYGDISAGDINLKVALLIQTKLQALNQSGVLPCNVYLTRTTSQGVFLKDASKLMTSSTEELVIRASNCPASVSYILPHLANALDTDGDKIDHNIVANANRLLNDEEYRQRANLVTNTPGGCDLFLSIYTGMDLVARDGYNYMIYIPGAVCVDEMRSPGHKEHLFRLLTSNVLEDSTRFATTLATNLENDRRIPAKDPTLRVQDTKEAEFEECIIPACTEFPIFHRNLRTLRIAESKITCYAELLELEDPKGLEFVKQQENVEHLASCFVRTIADYFAQPNH